MNTTPMKLSIDLGAIAGDTKPEKGPVEAYVSHTLETGQELSCRSALDPATLEQVREKSAAFFPKLLDNPALLLKFGVDALDGVNSSVDRIADAQGDIFIPEVDKMTKEMSRIASDFSSKYKPSSTKGRDATIKLKDFLNDLFAQGKDILEQLKIDSMNARERLDRVAAQLVVHEDKLIMNAEHCKELYEANERSILQLIGVIAMMEEMRDLAKVRAGELQRKRDEEIEGSVQQRLYEEQLTKVTTLIMNFDVRINEFMQQLYMAWTTAPQIRNIEGISFSLAQRVTLLRTLTLNTLKRTITQWGTVKIAESSSRVVDDISAFTNEVMQQFAAETSQSIPEIQRAIQNPTLTSETILLIADSIVAQHEGMVAAVREGEQKRRESSAAILTAKVRFTASGQAVNDELIAMATKADRDHLTVPAPELPEVIMAEIK